VDPYLLSLLCRVRRQFSAFRFVVECALRGAPPWGRPPGVNQPVGRVAHRGSRTNHGDSRCKTRPGSKTGRRCCADSEFFGILFPPAVNKLDEVSHRVPGVRVSISENAAHFVDSKSVRLACARPSSAACLRLSRQGSIFRHGTLSAGTALGETIEYQGLWIVDWHFARGTCRLKRLAVSNLRSWPPGTGSSAELGSRPRFCPASPARQRAELLP
jgi:hypothetical protein